MVKCMRCHRVFFTIAIYLFCLSSIQSQEQTRQPDDERDIVDDLRAFTIQAYEKDRGLWSDRELLPFAYAYADTGKSEAAIELYAKYLATAPNSLLALKGYGAALVQAKHFEDRKSVV